MMAWTISVEARVFQVGSITAVKEGNGGRTLHGFDVIGINGGPSSRSTMRPKKKPRRRVNRCANRSLGRRRSERCAIALTGSDEPRVAAGERLATMKNAPFTPIVAQLPAMIAADDAFVVNWVSSSDGPRRKRCEKAERRDATSAATATR